MKGIHDISFTLKEYSAIDFAQIKIDAIRRVNKLNYYQVMKDLFSGKEDPTLEECEQNAFRQYLNEYKNCCEVYLGWMDNGRVFILDKGEKLVLALYKKDEFGHSAIVHYNPLKVDLIEKSIPIKTFQKGFESGRYDLSTNEDWIVKECDNLISKL